VTTEAYHRARGLQPNDLRDLHGMLGLHHRDLLGMRRGGQHLVAPGGAPTPPRNERGDQNDDRAENRHGRL